MMFWIALAIAAFVTSCLAMVGFNRPSWLRTYTTASRYYDGMVVHMFLYLAIMLLVCVPLYAFRTWIGMDDETPVALGLLVAVIVRFLPGPARRMREWAHRLAGVPATGRSFAAAVAEADLRPTERSQQEALKTLLSRGIDVRQNCLPPLRPMHELLRKTTSLYLDLRQWEEDSRFSSFVEEARNDFDALRQRFDRLLLRVARALANIERIGKLHALAAQGAASPSGSAGESASDLVRTLIDNTASDLCEDLRQFYRDACLFTVRGLMAGYWTRGGRSAALSRFGFEKGAYEPPPSRGIVLFQTALLLYFACWAFVLLAPGAAAAPGSLDRGAKILLVTLLVSASVAIAAIPKRRWGFANAGIRRRTPFLFVIGAGVAAVLVACVLSLVVGTLFVGGAQGALLALKETSVMLHSMFLTAVATAWLVQDHRWGEASDRRKRWCDTLVFVGTWVAGTLLWATLMDIDVIARAARLNSQEFGGLETVNGLVFSLVVGGPIGYFMPMAMRSPRRPTETATAPREVELLLAEVEALAAGFVDSEPTPSPAPPFLSPSAATAAA